MLYCSAFGEQEIIPDMFWIVVLFMSAVIALFYMLGKLLSKSEFEAFAKIEMREILVSIAIAFGSVGIVFGLCNLSTAVLPLFSKSLEAVGGADMDQFRLAEVYLGTLANSIGVPTIINLETLAYGAYLIQASVRTSTGVNVLAATRTFSDAIGLLIGLIFSPLLASLQVQLITMSLAKYISLTVILPAGIVARAFKPTREGGAFLIALAVGMHFLWPFLYLINYEVTLRVFELLPVQMAQPPVPSAFPGTEMINLTIDMVFNNLQNGSQLLLQGLVLPVLNITMFIGFVRIFSEFIMSIR